MSPTQASCQWDHLLPVPELVLKRQERCRALGRWPRFRASSSSLVCCVRQPQTEPQAHVKLRAAACPQAAAAARAGRPMAPLPLPPPQLGSPRCTR